MKMDLIKSVFFVLVFQLCLTTSGQSPIADFSFSKANYCKGENLVFQNSSSNSDQYLWDFCTGDLQRSFSYQSTYDYSGSLDDLKVISNNGLWYGFTLDRSTNSLLRFDFNESLGNNFSTPVSVSMPVGISLNQPNAIDFIQDAAGNWYAFVLNLNSDDLIRLDFGTSIQDGIESGSNLGDLGAITSAFGIEMVFDGTGYRGVITDRTEFIFLDFISGITSPPNVNQSAIAGSSFLRGISIIFDGTNWYGLVADQNTHEVIHISFGTEVNSTFSLNEIDLSGVSLTTYRNVDFVYNGGIFYGFAVTGSGNLVRMIFGSDASNHGTTDIENLGDINPNIGNNVVGLQIVSDSSDWYGFGASFGGELDKFFFDNSCDASISYSSEETPFSLSFTSAGTFEVDLIAYSGNESSTITKSIDILDLDAPLITYSIDNVCVNSIVTFTPSNPGLSYSWNFGDGSPLSNEESPMHQYVSTGTYTVRVDVNDGFCENFYEEEISIYDPPPAPTYTYSSARTCINADFTFTNTTSDGAYVGPLEYLWEFIDEPSGTVVATATTKDAVYAFETQGQKTVRLTSSIPGCNEITEQTLMITPGPTANFSATSVCQNEAMQFTNTSLDAISYSWDFGDGFMSTATNPSHIFSSAGNYFATLTATDAEGCEDSVVIEVSVSDSPQINFGFDVPCTSADGIHFFDLSTVENADLVSWTWYLDGVEVSSQQSPQIVFESTGIVNVRLDVQSSNGCESSYSEDIEVLTSPEPEFTESIGCQGEASVFTDNTSDSGNPIVSWLWTVDGVNYGTQDINHIFTEAGLFDVTLEVTGQNFCSETITKTIEIIELPSIGFSVDGECDNQLIRVQDQSSASADPVVSRRWMLDGLNVGSGSQLLLESLADDTYQLALELETASGCVISAAQTLEINVAPESSFTSSRTYGIPGDSLSFSNSSTGAISYQWLLNESVISTDAQSQNINFTDAGIHIVSLVAQNSLGCNDTTSQEILIAIPEVDISIGSFELVRENNTGKIFLEVQNFSNLPIEITEAQIVLENQFTVTEQILKFIDVGESRLVSLNVGIPLNISEPSYFCVKLTSQYVDFPDVNRVNNEKCLTIKPDVQVEDPFPNPVTDQFSLKVIIPEEDVAFLRLLNSAGKIQSENHFNANEGLNNFFVDMSTLDPGIYFVTVEVDGNTFRRKVIKL